MKLLLHHEDVRDQTGDQEREKEWKKSKKKWYFFKNFMLQLQAINNG